MLFRSKVIRVMPLLMLILLPNNLLRSREKKVIKVTKVLKVFRGKRETLDLKVLLVHKVKLALKDLEEKEAKPVLKDLKELESILLAMVLVLIL